MSHGGMVMLVMELSVHATDSIRAHHATPSNRRSRDGLKDVLRGNVYLTYWDDKNQQEQQ